MIAGSSHAIILFRFLVVSQCQVVDHISSRHGEAEQGPSDTLCSDNSSISALDLAIVPFETQRLSIGARVLARWHSEGNQWEGASLSEDLRHRRSAPNFSCRTVKQVR